MKVWVLQHWINQDDSSVDGVYASVEAAKAARPGELWEETRNSEETYWRYEERNGRGFAELRQYTVEG